jgi:hypothetical protein
VNPILDTEDLEYAVYQQARKLSIALTLHAEATGDWGPSGADFGRQSVVRWLCDIPAHTPCHPERSDYLLKLTEAAQQYQFRWWPDTLGDTAPTDVITTLDAYIADFVFEIGDKKFSLQEGEDLDRLLAEKGSNLIIISGYHGTERNLIVGRGTRHRKAPYTHISLETEYLRSPSIVMPIVAMIGVHNIVVRALAVETIFHDKWVAMTNPAWHFSPADKLGFTIKKKTLENYGVSTLSKEMSLNIYPHFLSDMQLLLTAHEVGHGIIQHDRLPENSALMAESSQLLGDNILIALLELLADIAPKSSYGQGPILEIVDRIHTKAIQARRCFGLYLSDAYFYDTNTPHMFSYSHLILPVMAAIQSPIQDPGRWLDTNTALALLDDVANWAMAWVKELTDTLYTIFEVTPANSDEHDPLKRYIEKGNALHEALSQKTAHEASEFKTANTYLNHQMPIVYESLYKKLGYTDIDAKNPTDGIVKLLTPLFS